MELKQLVKDLPQQQRRYIIAVALGARENALRDMVFIGEPTIEQWALTDERFNRTLRVVEEGDFVIEAIKLWVNERVLLYLRELDGLARARGHSRVKLEAIRQLLTMVGTDKKVIRQELTAIEEYILGNKKVTLITRGEG